MEQSGELSWYRQLLLKDHLAHCPDCRQYRAELMRITDITRNTVSEKDIGKKTIEHILAEAEKEQSRSEVIRFRPSHEPAALRWRPAIIYSTISIFLLGAFLVVVAPLLKERPALVVDNTIAAQENEMLVWDDGFDEQLESIDEILQTVFTELDENGSMDPYDANTLASELLELEKQI